jgi:hypothetical protein
LNLGRPKVFWAWFFIVLFAFGFVFTTENVSGFHLQTQIWDRENWIPNKACIQHALPVRNKGY